VERPHLLAFLGVVGARCGRRVADDGGVVPDRLHSCDEVVGRHGWLECDRRSLEGVVDGRVDAVELVESLLDPCCTRRAGHAGERQLDAGRRGVIEFGGRGLHFASSA
jgi:hypothetical protein